jgi:two-component system C4-dicarboxylate transport sensor histidine kinase DctB
VSAQLDRKTAELKRTDAILQQARDAAVQAGKLTMLGQMSAGMTHELNQPLAALNTLSDNAVQLIEHDRVAEARENLVLIGQLAQRMGRIVTQLKVFARKEPAAVGPVAVARAVDNALMIVEPTRRETGANIEVQVDPALQVRADAARLEQVLVNLLRNGLDALAGRPAPLLRVSAGRDQGRVRIAVQDNGAGIAEETLAHLFEPFHTTKPAGQGLGLGLALSLAIVESFDGQLAGRNLDEGGAEFSVTLAAA